MSRYGIIKKELLGYAVRCMPYQFLRPYIFTTPFEDRTAGDASVKTDKPSYTLNALLCRSI